MIQNGVNFYSTFSPVIIPAIENSYTPNVQTRLSQLEFQVNTSIQRLKEHMHEAEIEQENEWNFILDHFLRLMRIQETITSFNILETSSYQPPCIIAMSPYRPTPYMKLQEAV